mgnify:FL=1
MTAIKWLCARWRWRRARRARGWALQRARLAHGLSVLDHERDPLRAGWLGPGRLPRQYQDEIAALTAASQAKSPSEFVAVLLPVYYELNAELQAYPSFYRTFAFREEIGWLLYEADPSLGHPGAQGPLAY